jgi:gamma-glutamyltranspeptidase/glutathione hydrolase
MGIDLFYRGEVAEKIIELSGSEGGLIQENDLSSYRVKKKSPITCEFAGYEVFLNPPPAQSGWLIQTTLRILNEARCRQNLPITLKDFVIASDLTSRIRKGQTTIGSGHKNHFEIDRDCLERFEEQLTSGRTLPSPGRGCTTQVSILDSEGNAASVTTSNGEGSGHLIPETGIMLNNMLGEEDINPGGFHRHSPGYRLPSMMSPTLVLKEKKPVLVTGTSGSNRIRSALAQLLVHHLYRKIDIKRATELPRVHLENDLLDAEPGVNGNDLQKLPAVYQVQCWKSKNLFFGGVNSATPAEGAADSRRGGKSVEFENRL